MDSRSIALSSAAVWMYGSHARGDADAVSDLDVLVISEDSLDEGEVVSFAELDSPRLSISQYTWAEIRGMASYGSLFLQHIRLEGRCLKEGGSVRGQLAGMLESMSPYARVAEDVAGFRLALLDVRDSLERNGSSAFEASVLATLLRHASILGCYISGLASFGRIEPVRRIVRAWNLAPEIADRFPDLYGFRIRADQHRELPESPPRPALGLWCEHIEEVICRLEEHARDYKGRMSTPR